MLFVSKVGFAAVCFCFLLTLASVEARADAVTFSTTGKFACGGCNGDGTTAMQIGTRSNLLILVFSGVENATVETGASGFTFASFGEIKVTHSGAGSTTFPEKIQLTITVTQTGPSRGSKEFVGVLTGTITGNSSTGELTFTPTSFSIGAIKYDIDATFKLVPDDTNGGKTSIQGKITATPEPATMILFGTSLLGVAGALRFRRRRL